MEADYSLGKHVELRRLDPRTDTALYTTMLGWDINYPRWYQRAANEFELAPDERADTGVFVGGELVSAILLTPRGRSAETSMLAKRGTSIDLIAEAAVHVKLSLFNQINVDEVYCWVAKRNKPVSKVCILSGMRDEGVRMLKGSYGTRAIEWVRWVVRRGMLEE